MKKLILAALLFVAAGAAHAATYLLTVAANDPVAAGPSFTPAPKVWYRVAGGAWTLIPGAAVTSQLLHASTTITANAGDMVEVKTQACNAITSLCADESGPIPAYAPVDAQPYTGATITVTKP